uniref:Uncharacterized protein n=1 Tax=Arundo donax TaxID=35708 RepID=A0A0A8ZLI2_ARUDO
MRPMCTPKTTPGSSTGMEGHAALEDCRLACSSRISVFMYASDVATCQFIATCNSATLNAK